MKTALITGGASGLGKTISSTLAASNYNLIITYNTSSDLASLLKKELEEKYKVDIILKKVDIAKEEDIRNLYEMITIDNIKIDVLINNAAVCLDSLYEDKTKENFMKTLEVNVTGTFLMSKYFGDLMYKNKSGVIINLTSTNGIDKYYPMSLDYDASKAGIISLTHNLSLQYSPYVRVNAVAPGWVRTENEMKDLDQEYIKSEEEKIYLKRFAEPSEIANVIEFLVSDKASYVNNTVIRVDGGTYSA